jgi:hypothetical protein
MRLPRSGLEDVNAEVDGRHGQHLSDLGLVADDGHPLADPGEVMDAEHCSKAAHVHK